MSKKRQPESTVASTPSVGIIPAPAATGATATAPSAPDPEPAAASAPAWPDETVPGGRYLVGGVLVDANGRPIEE